VTINLIRYRQPWRRMIVRFALWIPAGWLRDRLTEFLYPSDAVLTFPEVHE
jgi:hypothetical protein